MANTKSALKSIKKSKRNFLRNRSNRSAIRTIYKKCLLSIQNFNTDENIITNKLEIDKQFNYTFSKLDKAVKQGIYHKNKAARLKQSLHKEYKKIALG